MSVLIKGLDMPKNCGRCRLNGVCEVLPLEEWPDLESIYTNDVIGVDGVRHKDCPLVEVPTPHGKLIDADALKKKKQHSSERAEKIVAIAEVDWMPTIIEAEE